MGGRRRNCATKRIRNASRRNKSKRKTFLGGNGPPLIFDVSVLPEGTNVPEENLNKKTLKYNHLLKDPNYPNFSQVDAMIYDIFGMDENAPEDEKVGVGVGDAQFKDVSIQVFMRFMYIILTVLREISLENGDLPENMSAAYELLYDVFSKKALPFNATSVNSVLKRMPAIHARFDPSHNEGLLDIFEDDGLYLDEKTRKVCLKPAALITIQQESIPTTPMVSPPVMYENDVMGDIPFDPNAEGKFCIIVQKGESVSAATFPKALVKEAINPRTPRWLYMICKEPTRAYFISEDMVYPKLYLGLQKIGFPQQLYVGINELNSVIDHHNCVIIKPRMVEGHPYLPQIASASLFGVPGEVEGRSHCEVGHVGGIYDLFIPDAEGEPSLKKLKS